MIKLFSEKVEPTFTSSGRNILQVENFEEIFFDVYEFEINGNKYPAEKISEHNGNPVVSVPVEVKGKKSSYPFILIKGELEVIFNESSTEIEYFGEVSSDENKDDLRLFLPEERELEDIPILEDRKEEILQEIKNAKREALRAAKQEIEANKEIGLQYVEEEAARKEKALTEYLESARENLVNEFINISNKIRDELSASNSEEFVKIDESVDKKVDGLGVDIYESLDNRISEVELTVRDYYDNKLKVLEEKTFDINEESRKYFVNLIQESRDNLINEIRQIKNEKPVEYIIEANGNRQVKDFDSFRKDFDKQINEKINTEIINLKKYISMYSSGGGSIAAQFADGGTMNGNLLVVGSLSAREYLGIDSTLSQYLPLSGGTLTGDLAFNTGDINNVDAIQFNTTLETEPNTGQIGWNSADGTLDIGLNNNVTIPLGEKEVVYVKATEEIKRGQCVYASGAVGGGSGNITVSLFSAISSGVDELRFLGIATQDFATNDFGYAATFGKIKDVDPQYTRGTDDPQYALPRNQGWTLGTILYISATQPGRYTSIPPEAPNKTMAVAIVISENGNTRTLFVRAEHGYQINDLHDVRISNPQNNQLLTFNSTLSTWDNTSNINVSSLSATTIHALSSFVEVIDIKQYELSGFNVKGDATIQGSVSASNMTINNLQVATNEVGPALTYTSGNLTRVDYDSGNYKIFSYTDDILTQVDYVVGSTTIRKTLNYNLDGTLASVDQTII